MPRSTATGHRAGQASHGHCGSADSGLLDQHPQGMYCQYTTIRNLGRRIKHLRESQGLTQPALAAKARVSVSYLAKLEAGERKSPSAPALGRLARALGAAP